MRAAVFKEGRFNVRNVPDPSPGPGQVLVRPLVCGICGSDLHTRHHRHGIADLLHRAGFKDFMDPDKPVIMGHEFACEVIDYGPECERRFARGERVTALPFAAGVNGVELLGYSNAMGGAFAEAMVLQEDAMFGVPDHVPTDVAALAEPLSVAIHAINAANAGPGCAFVVYGCGPVGLFVIARLRNLGLGPVLAIDPDPARRVFAERVGADEVIAPSSEATARFWSRHGAPIGMSDASAFKASGARGNRAIIFECVGKPGMIKAICEDAPVGAQIIVAGVCMEPDAFEPALMVNKELSSRFVFAYNPEEFAEAVRMISANPDALAPLVTGHAALDDITSAFDTLDKGGSQAKLHIKL